MSKQERGDPDSKHAERNGPETSRSGQTAQEEVDTGEVAEEQDDRRVTAQQPFPIVGVGASAGGIEALTRFVKSIRRDSGMAYVLILHLDPSKGSQLADILGRETEVPVVNAEDGLAIEADRIYVCVPDRDIRIADGAFRLDKQIRDQGPPHPVDVFLNSLAENQANLSAAVILSGTGSNGSHGIKAINQYGGIILVQDPETARFCGMPAATISSGLADFVLPPEAMAETLSSYFDTTQATPSLDTTERPQQFAEQLAKILDTIRSKAGCNFQGYKKKMLLRRVRRWMGLIGICM